MIKNFCCRLIAIADLSNVGTTTRHKRVAGWVANGGLGVPEGYGDGNGEGDGGRWRRW